jgi:hypothetical protein
MDKIDTTTDQILAGVVGAIIGTDWWDREKVKTAWHGLLSVIAGAGSAVYLTPLVAKQLGWNTSEQVVGLAFAIGTLGLRSVQLINKMAEKAIGKLEGGKSNELAK